MGSASGGPHRVLRTNHDQAQGISAFDTPPFAGRPYRHLRPRRQALRRQSSRCRYLSRDPPLPRRLPRLRRRTTPTRSQASPHPSPDHHRRRSEV